MKRFLIETGKILLIAGIVSLAIKPFFQAFRVQGASMEEIIHDKDRLIIEDVSYRFREPGRGDMIVFRAPTDQTQFFVKRVIGLPGETVRIVDNQVRISDAAHPQGWILDEHSYLDPSQRTLGNLTFTLKADEFFVLGDNRIESSDSREWGPVNRSMITGRVFSRAWPLSNAALFRTPAYQ